jgi:hypothetical protein
MLVNDYNVEEITEIITRVSGSEEVEWLVGCDFDEYVYVLEEELEKVNVGWAEVGEDYRWRKLTREEKIAILEESNKLFG